MKRLFEENVSGRMNDANYEAMFSQYQAEQQGLNTQVDELSKKLTVLSEVHDTSQRWIELIVKYKDLQDLDAPIVNELCEKILLHQAYKVDGKRVQKYNDPRNLDRQTS